MPNYDLGRAHGKIVIDTDKRGIDDSNRALGQFEKTVQKLDRVLDRFERVLTNLERQLESVAAAAHRADRALDDLDGSVASVHKNTLNASRSVNKFDGDLRSMISTALSLKRAFDRVWAPIDHVRTSMAMWNNANTFRGYASALNKTVLFTAAMKSLGGRIIGVNRAYGQMNERQQNFLRTAGKISAVAAGFATLNKLVPALGRQLWKLDSVKNVVSKLENGYMKLWQAAAYGEGRIGSLARSLNKFITVGDRSAASLLRLYRTSNQVSNSLNSIASGAVKALVGFKVMQQAVGSLRKQFAFLGSGKIRLAIAAIAGALSLIGPAAEIGAKGLTIVSNAANLLWNAGKQLAGGLLAIPGIFGTILGAAIPIASTFKRLGTLFEDVFKAKDAEEMAKAIEALPIQLKPLGKRLGDLKKSLTEIGDTGMMSFIGPDAIKEIDTLEAALKGPLTKNFALINNAARQFRQELISVASDGKNITGLNQVFQSSRTLIDNLRSALSPFIDGMRDLVVVGSQFFADWTSGADRLAQRFANWMAVARQTGQLRKYMDDALQGAKDLIRGTVDLGKGLGKLLTLFATDTGDNALERYAKSMKKFNEAVERSRVDGVLAKISRAVKDLGFDRLNQLKDTINELKVPFTELAQAAIPFFKGISEGFKDAFIPFIKVATQLLELFVGAFSGLEPAIGWILGAAAGFKLLAAIAKPIANVGKAVIGLVIAMKGLQGILYSNALISFVGVLDRLLPGTNKASKGFDRLEGAIGKVGTALSRFLAIAAIPLAAFAIYKWADSAKDTISDFNKVLDEGKKNVAEYQEALAEAFGKDNGLVGKNVFDTVTTQMSDMQAQLDKQASKVPGWVDNFKDFFNAGILNRAQKDAGGSGVLDFGQSTDFNNLQKVAQDAQHAKKQFDELGLSSKDLAAVVTGSDQAFKSFVQTLRDSNKNDAANALQSQREVFKSIQQDFATASEGSVGLVNAINEIGNAGDDTASKLSALNAALKALGFNKADEYEAAFAFADAIRKLGDEAANAVDKSQPLEGIFGPDGVLAKSGPAAANAENLYRTVKGAVDAFKDVAASGGDIDAAWKTLQDSLGKTATAFQTDIKNVQGLVTNLTGNDYIVKLLMTIEGEDKVKAQVAAILAQYANGGPGQEIKIPLVADVDKSALQKRLDELLGSGKAAVGNQTLTISGANLTPEAVAALQREIPGLSMPGAPAPKPAEVAVAPKPVAPPPGAAPQVGPIPAPESVVKNAPAAPAPKVDTTELDKANAEIKKLQDQLAALQATVVKPTIDPSLINQVSEIEAKIASLQTKVNEFSAKDVTFKIVVQGVDETVFVFNSQLPQAIQKTIQTAQQIAQAFQTAFSQAKAAADTFVAGVQSALANLVAGASAQGSAFVDAFAAGLSSNGAAIAAADKMAADIKARFHQSPPKKGPLSAHGDAARYAGGAFVDAYAGGMDANGSAIGAANRMAGGVGQAAQGPYDLGKLLGVANDFVGFASKLADMFGQISDQILNAAKFLSDPLQEGKFFGQKLYGRDPNVSDRQLERQREDELQSKLQSAASGAAKDVAKEQIRTEKEAQEATKQETKDKKKSTAQTPEQKAAGKAQKKAAEDAAKQNVSKDEVIKSIQDGMAEGDDKWTPEQLAEIQDNTAYSVKTQEQMLQALKDGDPNLGSAIDILKDDKANNEQIIKALPVLDAAIEDQTKQDTAASRANASALESIRGEAMSSRGLAEQDPIGQVQQIAGQAASFAKDVFASIQSVLESVGAAKNIADTLVRGVENSEDVMKLIDNFQQFLSTAAQIASTVASGLSIASSITSAAAGADPSGGASGAASGLAAASQIASLISGAISTVNGIIDLTQEAYRIAGKYFGEFLGFLTGGAGGQLMGDVKFLLDENDGTLKTWSADNPEDKRSFDNPFSQGGTTNQQPQIGEINVFPERGTDPAELTNEMMFAVAAASSGAGNYQ